MRAPLFPRVVPRIPHQITAFGGIRARTFASILAALLGLSACSISSLGGGTPAGPTATPGPSPTPTPTVVYQNSLAKDTGDWNVDQDCLYGVGGYHITSGVICFAPAGTLTNVDASVQVEQIKGATTVAFGMIFRGSTTGGYYEFDVDSNSKWLFRKCGQTDCTRVVDFTPDTSILGGLNTTNTLEVVAIGSHFDFLVNGTKVGQADDSTYTVGKIGLGGADGIEVVYSNIKIIRPAS